MISRTTTTTNAPPNQRGFFYAPIPHSEPLYFWGMWVILALQLFASFFNAIMDKHQFHYQKSIFAYWAEKDNWLGLLMEWWSGPDSWKNSEIPSGFKWFDLLKRTALVPLYDLWHNAQFWMFTCFQIGLAICMVNEGILLGLNSSFWAGVCWVLILKALHGIAFNPTFYKLLDRPPLVKRKTQGNDGESKPNEFTQFGD